MSKDDYWLEVALNPTGVAAGTYLTPQITIDKWGRITNAATGSVSSVPAVSTTAQLPSIASPSSGDLAVVLDDGSGNEEMYVWNDANADVGSPLNRWKLLSNTGKQTTRKDYRQAVIDITTPQNIGTVIPDTGIIKRVSVTITTPYSGGATIEVQNGAAFVLMPFSSINPQLAGTYNEDLSGNVDDMVTLGSGQVTTIVGGVPGAGAGVVYIDWIDV
jgi:hypothetical protein